MNDQRESDDEGFGERKKANSVRRSGRSGRAARGVERRVSSQRAMKYTLDSLTASAPEGPAEIGANYRCHLTFRPLISQERDAQPLHKCSLMKNTRRVGFGKLKGAGISPPIRKN